MLKRLHDTYPTIREVIVRTVRARHRISMEDLPPSDDRVACDKYRPKLCRAFYPLLLSFRDADYFWEQNEKVVHSDGSDISIPKTNEMDESVLEGKEQVTTQYLVSFFL